MGGAHLSRGHCVVHFEWGLTGLAFHLQRQLSLLRNGRVHCDWRGGVTVAAPQHSAAVSGPQRDARCEQASGLPHGLRRV